MVVVLFALLNLSTFVLLASLVTHQAGVRRKGRVKLQGVLNASTIRRNLYADKRTQWYSALHDYM